MANRKVQVDILADETNFVRGTGKAGAATSKLSQLLSKLGPVGQGLQNILSNVGMGSIGMAGGIGIAAAAVSAAGVFINKAIDQYTSLGETILGYANVTGQSAEASSRQVQAFGELGVSADTAQSAMFKLSKMAEATPKKLEALGISVAKDSAGNIDLNATLLNVIDAYQGTTDAGKRALIMFDAFGKGGQAMIPILESNAKELSNLEAQIKVVYTDADLQKIRQAAISEKELNQSWQNLIDTIGREFFPVKAAVIDGLNENIYVNEHLDEQMKKMGLTYGAYRGAAERAIVVLDAQYKAAQAAKTSMDQLTQSQQDAANTAQAEADAENTLYTSLLAVSSASDKFKDATIKLKEDQFRALDSLDAYNKAVKEHGANSRVAQEAALAYQSALQSLRESYEAVALAAVDNAEKQATANGVTLTASQKADIYRKSLEDLEKKLGKNDPLRKNLEAYIKELADIPSSVDTSITDTYHATSKGRNQAFAGGGVVAGSSSEHAVMAKAGEGVFTPEQMAALPGLFSGGNSGGDVYINIHVDRGAFIDGPSVDRLANVIAQRLSYVTGR